MICCSRIAKTWPSVERNGKFPIRSKSTVVFSGYYRHDLLNPRFPQRPTASDGSVKNCQNVTGGAKRGPGEGPRQPCGGPANEGFVPCRLQGRAAGPVHLVHQPITHSSRVRASWSRACVRACAGGGSRIVRAASHRQGGNNVSSEDFNPELTITSWRSSRARLKSDRLNVNIGIDKSWTITANKTQKV